MIDVEKVYEAGRIVHPLDEGDNLHRKLHLNGLRAVAQAAYEDAARIAENWSAPPNPHGRRAKLASAIRAAAGDICP